MWRGGVGGGAGGGAGDSSKRPWRTDQWPLQVRIMSRSVSLHSDKQEQTLNQSALLVDDNWGLPAVHSTHRAPWLRPLRNRGFSS